MLPAAVSEAASDTASKPYNKLSTVDRPTKELSRQANYREMIEQKKIDFHDDFFIVFLQLFMNINQSVCALGHGSRHI